MTTQNNYSSPFISGASNVPKDKDLPIDTSKDFSIRTMHDDLLSLQKEVKPLGATIEIKTPQPIVETKKTATTITSSQIPVSKNVSINKTSSGEPIKRELSGLIEVPIAKKAIPNSSILYKTLLGAIVFFVIAIIGMGGYYYFFLKNKTIVDVPAETPVEVPDETPVITTPATEKYSSNMPNYLSFDPAKESLDELNKKLSSIAIDLENKTPQVIYEFSVVDSNNNPVMLPIFAAATKFNLSPKLLENLGENFSIFFYNEGGDMRLSIATTVKDKKLVTAEMLKQEKTLTSDTAFLFLKSVPENKLIKFSTSDYNGTPVRYFNFIANDSSLSVDYIVTDSNLVIGTSKGIARAISDKLLSKAPATADPQALNLPIPEENAPTVTD